jgi:CBS domain-containing protein
MQVKNVMTKDPKHCVPSDSAQHAAAIMREEHAGIVPVVEGPDTRTLVGVVTDRDLCMNVVAEGLDPRTVPVERCMTLKVVTCTPDDSVDRVTELMQENQIRRVPVVGDGHELQGIVALGVCPSKHVLLSD